MIEPIFYFILNNYPVLDFDPSDIRLSKHLSCLGNDMLHITKQGIYVELEPLDYYNGKSSFTFKLILRHDKIEGVLDVCSSIDLPDNICMEFYNLNIDIINSDNDRIYSKINQKYDREVIMRRHTIANIIK